MAPKTTDPNDIATLQELIEMMANGQISEEEGRRRFEELWDQADQDSIVRRVLRTFFPSLSSTST